MFGINKDQLVRNLAKIRKKICCYTRNDCDCRYIEDKDELTSVYGHMFSGENTGCCEVEMARKIFEVMPEKEFKKYCGMAQIIFWDE